MTRLDFTVAGDVQGKGRPRFNRKTGRAFTPKKTETRETLIAYHAQQAMAGRPLIEGPVAVSIVATFPIPKSWAKGKRLAASHNVIRPGAPDVDNIAKLQDAMNKVVWLDDRQVAELRVSKVFGAAPSTRFIVEELLP